MFPTFVLAAILVAPVPAVAQATTRRAAAKRFAVVEVFGEADKAAQQRVVDAVAEFASKRTAVHLQIHAVVTGSDSPAAERMRKIAAAFRIKEPQAPFVYCCGRVLNGARDPQQVTRELAAALRVDVYVRSGCSRCARAKRYVAELQAIYPCFEFRFLDVATDGGLLKQFQSLARTHNQAAVSVPAFHMFNQLVVGFDSSATTGERVRKLLEFWTFPVIASGKHGSRESTTEPRGEGEAAAVLPVVHPAALFLAIAQASEPLPPLPPLPPIEEAGPTGGYPAADSGDAIDLPWLGRVAVRDWGMPAFTIAVGLVDGFNPCAMWVLILLLSILVNVRDRLRIALIAGVFVLISGVAYFAFMAAWLNVFLLIGYLRPIQVSLAVLAIGIGCVHVKDFFAFKQGVSLSIPESAKPGIYARIRRVVNAENLVGAMFGVSVLAVMVNVVELLCTAGLPALYTQVLTQQAYPSWLNYAYLVLYNIAYMFDDSLMVVAVVVT
ncbi:MAG: hypothetical protein KDA37_10810, partial [Planctomycetales bacterium]|nr:hypothetical protein [Planctomycetales bacterium]